MDNMQFIRRFAALSNKLPTLFNNEYLQVFLFIVTVKIIIFLVAFAAFPIFGGQASTENIITQTADMWSRWDSLLYERLANFGYQATGPLGDEKNLIVFYPLYPLLIILAKYAVESTRLASFLVANLASIGGLYVFYCVARQDLDRRGAQQALAALLLFPVSYFFNASYTEGLFLLTSATAFYAARRQQWLTAALAGGLAGLTRVMGLALLPALLLEFFQQWRRQDVNWLRVFFLLLIPFCFSSYLYLNFIVLGDPLAFQEIISNHWYKHFVWPWQGMEWAWQKTGTYPFSYGEIIYGWSEFTAGLFLIAVAFVSFFRLRLSYSIFIATVTFLTLSSSFYQSTPRYILSAWPLFLLFGQVKADSKYFLLWLIFSTMLLSALTIQYTRGWWAF